MNFDEFLSNVLNDLRVELADEFDRNFENKSFFGVPWAPTKLNVNKGSLMIRTGDLRRSIRSTVEDGSIRFTSSLQYASIHNEGGKITVTPKMKAYFWAKYFELSGGIEKKKDGTPSNSKGNAAISAEAMFFKAMALKKVGSKITIPKRQFLGHHPTIDTLIEKVVDDNVRELAKELTAELSRLGRS